MEEVQIPDRFKPGLEKLVHVDDNTVNILIEALKQAAPSLFIDDLALAIAPKISGLKVEETEDILDFLLSLYNFRDYAGAATEDVIHRIIQAVQVDEELTNLSEAQKKVFEQRLAAFLDLDGVLGVASKAIGVMRDHERVFMRSRILTDMRPIFESDIEKGLAGIAIIHMLKIEYADLNGKHEFFVALDSLDIENLQEQLERANQKVKSLQSTLKRVEIPYLDYLDME